MAGPPTRHLISPDSDAWWAARGGPVFEDWERCGYPVVTSRHVGSYLRYPGWFLICVPGTRKDLDLMGRILANPERNVIAVDVCFPLMRPDASLSLEDPAGVAFWTDPGTRRIGVEAIRRADAVVTPTPAWDGYPTWVEDLADLNPNVYVIPDLRPGDAVDMTRFGSDLVGMWELTAAVKEAPVGGSPEDLP